MHMEPMHISNMFIMFLRPTVMIAFPFLLESLSVLYFPKPTLSTGFPIFIKNTGYLCFWTLNFYIADSFRRNCNAGQSVV